MATTNDHEDDALEMAIEGIEYASAQDDFQPLQLVTSRGNVACHYYPVPGSRSAVVWVGGVGGGFDTPAREMYPRLAQVLRAHAVSSLRVCFRDPCDLDEAVLDVLAGVAFLEKDRILSIALVGHSFGGAVVIRAAAEAEKVHTVVTLATQGYGTELVGTLAPRCSLLVVHGTEDPVLPAHCSEGVYRHARQPKRLVLFKGAGHCLDEAAGDVHDLVRDWITEKLGQPAV